MQEASTSTAGGGANNPHEDSHVPKPRRCNATGEPPTPEAGTARTAQLFAFKDGDPIPQGYALVVQTRIDAEPNATILNRSERTTVDLCTPPKAIEPSTGEGPDTAKGRTAARRNLTRNTNRKANATFAKDLKESLATGQPTPIKVAEDQMDLKCTWHAAAKETAYKLLDLTKESWKDYTNHEKTTVHNEVNEQFKFDPPIDPKRIDKYLSCHLRTSRAVWKAHWKKFGPSQRHHNCPQSSWVKLCKWWPTAACQEQAAEMACRRARVERSSKVGRSSLMDRMDAQVSFHPGIIDLDFII